MCTCTSMTPGRTMRPEASMTFSALGALEFDPIQVTFPPFEAIAQDFRDDETATLPFLITRSAELKLGYSPKLWAQYLLLYQIEGMVALQMEGFIRTRGQIRTHSLSPTRGKGTGLRNKVSK